MYVTINTITRDALWKCSNTDILQIQHCNHSRHFISESSCTLETMVKHKRRIGSSYLYILLKGILSSKDLS